VERSGGVAGTEWNGKERRGRDGRGLERQERYGMEGSGRRGGEWRGADGRGVERQERNGWEGSGEDGNGEERQEAVTETWRPFFRYPRRMSESDNPKEPPFNDVDLVRERQAMRAERERLDDAWRSYNAEAAALEERRCALAGASEVMHARERSFLRRALRG